MSRKATKSRVHGHNIRSAGTTTNTRIGRTRALRADLEKELKASRRELAEAREQQAPTKHELVINLKTAKALGLDVPPTLLPRR